MAEDEQIERGELLALCVEIVAAQVSRNAVRPADLPALIQSVFEALQALATQVPAVATLTPAVPIRRSVTDAHIVCLEDGLKFKMLKRHLREAYGLTPDQYRARWGLKPDYPMVAPDYAAQRRRLAIQIGLGRKPAPEPVQSPAPVQAPAPKQKRRRKSAA